MLPHSVYEPIPLMGDADYLFINHLRPADPICHTGGIMATNLKILGASIKAMNNAMNETGTIVSPEPATSKKSGKRVKLSAAELKQQAEDAKIEEAVNELAANSGVTMSKEKSEPAKVEQPKAVEKKQPKEPAIKPKASKEPDKVKAEKPASGKPSLYIHTYSEKSVAVFGETKGVKDQLKKLGGRFNPCLHPFGAESNVPGWIFPAKVRTELEAFISKL